MVYVFFATGLLAMADASENLAALRAENADVTVQASSTNRWLFRLQYIPAILLATRPAE